MKKDKVVVIRFSEEDKIKLEEQVAKTANSLSEYCRRLVLGYEVDNMTSSNTVGALIALWRKMDEDGKVDRVYLDELKKIVLACE